MMDTWTDLDAYEADKAYALHKAEEQARRDAVEWRRAARNNITVFLLSLAGWGVAAGLWWLGGKL